VDHSTLAEFLPRGLDTRTMSVRKLHDVSEETSSLLTRDELKMRERESIIAALNQAAGKVSGSDGAAALLGMKPTTLYSRILALGLRAKASANTNSRVAQASF